MKYLLKKVLYFLFFKYSKFTVQQNHFNVLDVVGRTVYQKVILINEI